MMSKKKLLRFFKSFNFSNLFYSKKNVETLFLEPTCVGHDIGILILRTQQVSLDSGRDHVSNGNNIIHGYAYRRNYYAVAIST